VGCRPSGSDEAFVACVADPPFERELNRDWVFEARFGLCAFTHTDRVVGHGLEPRRRPRCFEEQTGGSSPCLIKIRILVVAAVLNIAGATVLLSMQTDHVVRLAAR